MLNHAHRELSRFVDSAESSFERVRAMHRICSSDASPGRLLGAMELSEREMGLFTKWRSRLGPDADSFVKDGVIGIGGEWSKQTARVLFLAKDPHNRNNVMMRCGHDLRVLLRDSADYPETDKTLEKHCGAWARAIHCWWNDANALLKELPAGPLAQSELLCSAVVNVKKLAGGPKADSGEIAKCARDFKDLIHEQLEILQPTVIVCCGTYKDAISPAFGPFDRFGTSGRSFLRQRILWIDQWHPCYHFKTDVEKLNRLTETLAGIDPVELRRWKDTIARNSV